MTANSSLAGSDISLLNRPKGETVPRRAGSQAAPDFLAVLVINPDAGIRKALRVIFTSAGHFVWEAESLRDVAELVTQIRFDVVFVDKIAFNSSEKATGQQLRVWQERLASCGE